MRYFISQPMNGLTDKEIETIRNNIISKIEAENPDAVILDSFFKTAPHGANPLWFLGKSLELLSIADKAIFVSGWENARGCKIEHACCVAYGIDGCTYNTETGEFEAVG